MDSSKLYEGITQQIVSTGLAKYDGSTSLKVEFLYFRLNMPFLFLLSLGSQVISIHTFWLHCFLQVPMVLQSKAAAVAVYLTQVLSVVMQNNDVRRRKLSLFQDRSSSGLLF
jgi:hypothetical protein